jgi:ribosome-associated toxin RatA of RatAB toxin-antitoxin module
MAVVTRSVLLSHPAERMFELVADVASYPSFLPWCGGAVVRESTPSSVVATLTIAFKGLRQSFTTRNDNVPGRSIQMTLIDGPFSVLTGEWVFTPLSSEACRVDFQLDYRFSSLLLEKVVGSVFDPIAKSFVDAFVRRADELHGTAS